MSLAVILVEVRDEITEETWNSGKEKMKTLGTIIYSSRTNSEGRDYSLG